MLTVSAGIRRRRHTCSASSAFAPSRPADDLSRPPRSAYADGHGGSGPGDGREGKKRAVASAFDWPGWDRSAKTGIDVLPVLESYRPRYAPVAALAGLGDAFAAAGELEVVERLPGTGMGDFYGTSGRTAAPEYEQMSEAECERKIALLRACWAYFDEVAARVSPELRQGPRGGGRDRDRIVRHANGAEIDEHAKKVGVPTPLEALGDPRDPGPPRRLLRGDPRVQRARPTAGAWTVQFLIRRSAYHMLDHAWEMEDRDLSGEPETPHVHAGWRGGPARHNPPPVRRRPLTRRPTPRSPAIGDLQALMAEHGEPVSARSLAYNEAFTRAGMFLSERLGMSFVGLSLLGAALGFHPGLFAGHRGDCRRVRRPDRDRDLPAASRTTGREDPEGDAGDEPDPPGAYVRVAPGSTPFLTAGTHDDVPSVMRSYGFTRRSDLDHRRRHRATGSRPRSGWSGWCSRSSRGCWRRSSPWPPVARCRWPSSPASSPPSSCSRCSSGGRWARARANQAALSVRFPRARRGRRPPTARTAPPGSADRPSRYAGARAWTTPDSRRPNDSPRDHRHRRSSWSSRCSSSSLYNGLVTKRNRIDEAFGQIEVQLKRRHDLIPNLVQAVKGYMGFEQDVLTRGDRGARQRRRRGRPGPGRSRLSAENALTGALRSLFAVVENYPDLKANAERHAAPGGADDDGEPDQLLAPALQRDGPGLQQHDPDDPGRADRRARSASRSASSSTPSPRRPRSRPST